MELTLRGNHFPPRVPHSFLLLYYTKNASRARINRLTYKLYAVQHIFHPNIHIIVIVVGFGSKSLTKSIF